MSSSSTSKFKTTESEQASAHADEPLLQLEGLDNIASASMDARVCVWTAVLYVSAIDSTVAYRHTYTIKS